MTIARNTVAIFSGVTAAALLLSGTASACDSPETTASTAYLRFDKTRVTPGETVGLFATCGPDEQLNLVGSEAFAATGEDGPYEGNGGVAQFTQRVDDGMRGSATIRSAIAPGTYRVGQRCGGGNAGTMEITVIEG